MELTFCMKTLKLLNFVEDELGSWCRHRALRSSALRPGTTYQTAQDSQNLEAQFAVGSTVLIDGSWPATVMHVSGGRIGSDTRGRREVASASWQPVE